MEAQAAVDHPQPVKEIAASLCQPVRCPRRPRADGQGHTKPRRFRALNPFSPDDAALLEAISRAEFHQNGVRNRDLRRLLYQGEPKDEKQKRRRFAAVSRKLALLRAHGLIRKVPRTHRYTVTSKGRVATTALLAARNASTGQLIRSAA